MADKIVFSPSEAIVPGEHAAAVTLSDATTLDPTPRAIYVGTEGNLKVNHKRVYRIMKCPFCNGELIPSSYSERASFSCSKCKVIITFIESLEEVQKKYEK